MSGRIGSRIDTPNCTAPPILYYDNIGATYLTSNPMLHARTKYVEINFHFVHDRILSRNLTVQFLSLLLIN
jgi:hypothetical protein